MASAFKGAKSASISSRGEDLADGKSKVRIDKISMPNLRSGEAYIVDYTVVSSDNEANKVGARYRWFRSMAPKTRDSALGDLNKFMFAALGYNLRNSADEKIIEDVIKPDVESLLDSSIDQGNPLGLVGRLLDVTVKRKDNKKLDDKGQPYPPFANHDFEPGQTEKVDVS